MSQKQTKTQETHPPLRLVVEVPDSEPVERVFTKAFRMGRDPDCDVMIKNSHVSRNHIEIDYKDKCWWAHDLESTNGIYVNGKKVNHAPIMDADILHLGKDGPRIVFNYISAELAAEMPDWVPESKASWQLPVKNKILAFVLAAIVLGGAGFYYGQYQLGKKANLGVKAEELFTQIRASDIAIANVYAQSQSEDKLLVAQRIIELEQERHEAEEDYKGYLIQMGLYQSMSERQSQLYNTARFFNESELAMPQPFIDEVLQTIDQFWMGEGEVLLKEGLTRAQLFDYTPFVVKILEDYGLPTEFFYLPLTVSGFESSRLVESEYGIARAGIWQLSSPSALAYNISATEEPGGFTSAASDKRLDFRASTQAAVQLLHDIYRNEALASGLLTLAIYLEHERRAANTGSSEIVKILAGVPRDVNERTLWNIRNNYPGLISSEVYDEVLQIFAAAVIGQNPSLFNLDVNTPTASSYFKSF